MEKCSAVRCEEGREGKEGINTGLAWDEGPGPEEHVEHGEEAAGVCLGPSAPSVGDGEGGPLPPTHATQRNALRGGGDGGRVGGGVGV